ncbi:TTPAL protein, partial [Polypterus senegalus]
MEAIMSCNLDVTSVWVPGQEVTSGQRIKLMEEEQCLTNNGLFRDPAMESHDFSSSRNNYTCTLTPELIAKAREELQEKPEWRLRDVQALRDMILKEHPHLRTRIDDSFLLRFLRARKFDYDRSLKLLVNYYASRRSWPEVFKNLRPSNVKHVLDSGFLTVLSQPDPDGRFVLCLRPGKWRPNDYPFVDNIRAMYLTLEKLIQSEETQVNGIVILADYNGVGLSQASHLGPFLAKKVVGILQDGFPIRIKAVNVINEPRIFKGVFAIIKPFLKEKMAQRVVPPLGLPPRCLRCSSLLRRIQEIQSPDLFGFVNEFAYPFPQYRIPPGTEMDGHPHGG